jgi:transposase
VNEATNNYESLAKPELIALVVDYKREVEKLRLHIINANRKLFGRKTEKISDLALLFPPEMLGEPKGEAPASVTVKEHTREVKRGRKPLPENLPRRVIAHEPAEQQCTCCGAALVEISRDITEVLEYIPAQLEIHEHHRINKACNRCKNHGVSSGILPDYAQPLPGFRPGAGLLAQILVAKYRDALPYHRQSAIFERSGIEIPRQRMSDWTMEVATLVTPVYEELIKEILKAPYVQADETTLKVQDRTDPRNIITGYLWGVLQPQQKLVWYHYAPSRAGEVPKEIFSGYKGAVQTDLYAGYNQVYLPVEVQRIACLAHIRRRFVEARPTAPKLCDEILQLIAELYQVEKQARRLSPAERFSRRQQKSLPTLIELKTKLEKTRASLLPKHALQEALAYPLKQWDAIQRAFDNGLYEIDNNAIEREMRPIAIGRKNYLFAGSHNGARAAAILYSLLNSCSLNKVNPYLYLKDIITRCAVGTESLTDLIPHRWVAAPSPKIT